MEVVGSLILKPQKKEFKGHAGIQMPCGCFNRRVLRWLGETSLEDGIS